MAKKKSLIDLIQEAIDKGANSAEEIHRAIADKPLKLLLKIDVLSGPAKKIKRIQEHWNEQSNLFVHAFKLYVCQGYQQTIFEVKDLSCKSLEQMRNEFDMNKSLQIRIQGITIEWVLHLILYLKK